MKEIEVAVGWWTDVLRQPAKFDNGDKSGTGAVTQILAATISGRNVALAEEQLATFAKCLTNYLETELEMNRQKGWGFGTSINVDYVPDHRLSEAAKLACIEGIDFRFPWKTCMQIADGSVRVSCGYRAPWLELMPQ